MALSNQIRAYLKANGPTTVRTLADDLLPHLRYGAAMVRTTLHKMPDVYICAWTSAEGWRGSLASVWAVAEIPENVPKPTIK